MHPERPQNQRLEAEAEGVLVRPIGGQIYLVEEKSGEEAGPEDEVRPDDAGLAGLINRH